MARQWLVSLVSIRPPNCSVSQASGRLVRFGVLSVLTIVFGKEIVEQTKNMVKTHPTVMVLLVFAIFVVIYFVFRLLRQPAKEIAEEIKQGDQK